MLAYELGTEDEIDPKAFKKGICNYRALKTLESDYRFGCAQIFYATYETYFHPDAISLNSQTELAYLVTLDHSQFLPRETSFAFAAITRSTNCWKIYINNALEIFSIYVLEVNHDGFVVNAANLNSYDQNPSSLAKNTFIYTLTPCNQNKIYLIQFNSNAITEAALSSLVNSNFDDLSVDLIAERIIDLRHDQTVPAFVNTLPLIENMKCIFPIFSQNFPVGLCEYPQENLHQIVDEYLENISDHFADNFNEDSKHDKLSQDTENSETKHFKKKQKTNEIENLSSEPQSNGTLKYLDYISSSRPVVSGFNVVRTLADGNCGFNAIVIFIVKKFHDKKLPKEKFPEFYNLFSSTLGLNNSEQAFKYFLENSDLAEQQRRISSILRNLAVTEIKDNFIYYQELFEQQLLACFDIYLKSSLALRPCLGVFPLFGVIFEEFYFSQTCDLPENQRNKQNVGNVKSIIFNRISELIMLSSTLENERESLKKFYLKHLQIFLDFLIAITHDLRKYPFILHKNIRDKFFEIVGKNLHLFSYVIDPIMLNSSPLHPDLKQWWNTEACSHFINQFAATDNISANESNWAENFLLDALAHRLRFTIVLHHINSGQNETLYTYGVAGGLIEVTDDNKESLNILKLKGFGDFIRNKFQIKPFTSEEALYAELDKIPSMELRELTFALVDHLTAQVTLQDPKQTAFPNAIPDNLPHSHDFPREILIRKLVELRIIYSDTNGYRFISKEREYADNSCPRQQFTATIPDRNRIETLMASIDELSQAILISTFAADKNAPVCHILGNNGHFNLLEPCTLDSEYRAENPYCLDFLPEVTQGDAEHTPAAADFTVVINDNNNERMNPTK